MLQSGRVVFGQMEEGVFGTAAAEALAEQARRLDAQLVFLMVSGTLNRETDEIEKVRRALGERCAGTFDRMRPHTPRRAVIAAAKKAREAGADLIATMGGGSVTDGARAVQLCLANDIRTPCTRSESGRRASTVSPSRQWEHPGCRTIPGESMALHRCGKFCSWRRER